MIFDVEPVALNFDISPPSNAAFDALRPYSTVQVNTAPIRVFQEKTVPGDSRLVGWSALVRALEIQAPIRRPCAVSEQHVRGSRKNDGDWIVFDKRYWPGEDLGSHLKFALRYENIDLLVAKRLFETVPANVVQEFVRTAPTGVRA